jgi:PPM family protein phosphatase
MLTVLSFSEAGGHAVNEDAFAVERHPDDADCWLCFLADGQGGQPGGARASQLACRTAVETSMRTPRWKLAAPSTWALLLRTADEAVCAEPDAGFTMLVGFSVTAGGTLAGASCGDSAVLVAVPGERPREVTAGQFKNPPVGSGAAQFVPFGAALASPWAVLALSDGVWKYAGWERIVEAVSAERGERLVESIQRFARLRGSGRFADDFTLVIFEAAAGNTY